MIIGSSRVSALFLVTGFEPFGTYARNSSWDALELLRPSWPGDIVTRCLPVDHRAAHEQLRHELTALEPAAVLCTGLAKGSLFRVEHRARRPLALRGEAGMPEVFGRWPWQEMHEALQASGVQSVDSEDAGQYVCESTYWSLLNHSRGQYSPPFAAFLHVPPESLDHPVERIARAVGAVVDRRYLELAR
jgi:pyroglutamyl-peptidase